MRGIITFKLSEEEAEFEAAQRGPKLLGQIQEYDNYLRGRLKYEAMTKATNDALQDARDKLHEMVGDIWK